MCGGSPSVDTRAQDQAAEDARNARLAEEGRQQRIEFGLDQLDAIFGGGEYFDDFGQFIPGLPVRGDFDPADPARVTGSYDEFLARVGEPVPVPAPAPVPLLPAPEPTGGGDGPYFGFGFGGEKNRSRDDTSDNGRGFSFDALDDPSPVDVTGGHTAPELRPIGDVRTSAGFGDYLDDRRQAFLDFHLPQLQAQFNDARDQLTFALSRAGILNSTAAGERQGDLTERFGVQQGIVRSRADDDIQGVRANLADTKAALEAQLRATGDASAVTNDAINRAMLVRNSRPVLSPVADAFGALLTGIGQGTTAVRNAALNDRVRRFQNDPFDDGGRVVG